MFASGQDQSSTHCAGIEGLALLPKKADAVWFTGVGTGQTSTQIYLPTGLQSVQRRGLTLSSVGEEPVSSLFLTQRKHSHDGMLFVDFSDQSGSLKI